MTEPRPDRPPPSPAGWPPSGAPSGSGAPGGLWHLRIERLEPSSTERRGLAWVVSTFVDGAWRVVSRHATEAAAQAAVDSLESTGDDRRR